MRIILNSVFYIFGIILPISIISVALFKKSRHKKRNVLNKTLIAVILFLIFYIVKVGGINLMTNIKENKKVVTTLKKDLNESTSTNKYTNSIYNETNELKYVDGVLIVNKSYSLPRDFVPKDTYENIDGKNYCSKCLNKVVFGKFNEMKADANALGLNIWIQSGYRSYNLQENLYNKYIDKDGKEKADTYSARPGHSEHQTGLAFDLNTITDDFQHTDEGKWIHHNAYKYGFILRYPKGKEKYTGYKYESWHLRYVGEDLATKLYNNGDWITLEEHFNLTSIYKD